MTAGRDADRLFHTEWLGLAQPIEGLVFSVPVLAEAQIAPSARPEITSELRRHLTDTDHGLALRDVRDFFERFLGYREPGMLVPRAELPTFYAPESRQEIRPSFGIARGPFAPASNDPFAEFAPTPEPSPEPTPNASPYLALVWDLGDDTANPTALDLDAPEDATGPWRYPPTAKLERLLRHTGVPIGFVSNRRALRVVYAPTGETTSHLTFRMDDLADPAGRPIALALDLLFHARRTYSASEKFTFEGLLAESRRRQADVTEELAEQVRSAIERALEGLEAAAARDCTGDRVDWLRAALEAEQVHEGILNLVLRLVFLLYAEDRSLLPVDDVFYSEHLSVLGLHARLSSDAGAHPESMHQRFGAYGALTSLFRAVYFGVHHGKLRLPPRQGRLFDPSAYPFLEGGLPDWTAAVSLPEDRAAVQLPSVDDATVHDVLHRLVVLDGQRISYRDLSVEQIGAVYESLMGYRVERVAGPAVRLGKSGHWVEASALLAASKSERESILDDRCGLTKAAIKKALDLIKSAEAQKDAREESLADALLELAGTKSDRQRHRARAGQLVLQPTASRRSTGSHYTPRSLSERVVRRTLEPILACLGESPTAKDILELKVCDPAMGSGAFLVEACRFLGEAVVEAWRKSGELPAVIESHGDPLLHAKRLVAQRCLYGVDKNAAAVELAKLSLWLETLSGDKAFTFLDHVLRHGDSLVGLDVTQVRAFHWSPKEQLETVAPLVDAALAEVREHRDAIQHLADDDTDFAQKEKRRLLELADQAMERVKLVADACVGAFFAEAKPKAREEERARRLAVVERYLTGDEDAAVTVTEWAGEIRARHAPFHWHLELPEVFFLERPDPLEKRVPNRLAFVDAFVGNPPFAGKNAVIDTNGPEYLEWMQTVHEGAHGNADLSAHFFRRAAQLIGAHGSIGFISTNTVAQGDTRASGLQPLVTQAGFTIYDATRSLVWPGAASVSVSIVLLAKGAPSRAISAFLLDDVSVPAISSRLMPAPERPDPVALRSNANGSFVGSYVLGMGFTLTPDERDSLVEKDPRNGERIFPYLNGQECNQSPIHFGRRYVINFGQDDLTEAARWPDLLEIVRDKVKPERDQNKRANYRNNWWLFGEARPGLIKALLGTDQCFVTAISSKHRTFAFVPSRWVLDQTLIVSPIDTHTFFAVMQSRVYETWSTALSSTLKEDQRYTPSECFEPFPFPQPEPRTVIPELEDIGKRLYEARAEYMVETQQGLTQTYNKLKDPACTDAPIVGLRQLHEQMDQAVLTAYGWQDLQVPPFCPTTPAEEKVLSLFQDQVVDHLFVLNAQRAAEEARSPGKPAKSTAAATRGTKKSKSPSQGDLF